MKLTIAFVENECLELVLAKSCANGLRQLFRANRGEWIDFVVLKPDTKVPSGRVYVCWVDALAPFVTPDNTYRTVIWSDIERGRTYLAGYNLEALPPPVALVK